MRVLSSLYHQGTTPHAIVAGDDEESDSVMVVTSVFVEDIPAFLKDAASAVEEPEQTYLTDCTTHGAGRPAAWRRERRFSYRSRIARSLRGRPRRLHWSEDGREIE